MKFYKFEKEVGIWFGVSLVIQIINIKNANDSEWNR